MYPLPKSVESLLYQAAERGRYYEYDCSESPLLAAVERDCDAALELLLQAEYSPNVYKGPLSPLHLAAEKANSAIIQLLIKAGAKPDVPNGMFKQTPLHLAAEKGSAEAVKTLLANGANPNVENSYHYTPLVSAIKNNFDGSRDAVIDVLLEHEGIELNTGNEVGNPLHLAITKKKMPLIKKLIERGADINPIDKRYGSLLERVIRTHSEDLAIMLINRGDSPTSHCGFLQTPLHLAAEQGYVQLVKLLLEKGAANGQRDIWGKTALDIAREKGHNEIVKLLENPPCSKSGN